MFVGPASSPAFVAQPKRKIKDLRELDDASEKVFDASTCIPRVSKLLRYIYPSYFSSLIPPKSKPSPIQSHSFIPSCERYFGGSNLCYESTWDRDLTQGNVGF